MSYEPRGKVKTLLDAMRAEPGRIWTSPDVAKVMDVHQGALTAHLDTAVRNSAIYRRLEGGRCQYSIRPFAPDGSAAALPAPAPAPTWTAPKMVAPRAGSDAPHVSAPIPSPPPPPPAEPAPEPQRQPVPEPEPEPARDPELHAGEEEEEPAEFDACVFRDGRVQVWGLVVNEDGSVSITAQQAHEIKRLIAWAPPPCEEAAR